LDWSNKTKEEKESAGSPFFPFVGLFSPPSSATMNHLPLIFVLCAASCVSTNQTAEETPQLIPGDPSAPSQVTPDEAMAIAQRYASHSWRPFARNILHGKDKAGILVNTPDVSHQPQHERRGWWIPGEANQGVPYKWGGFDDPASFDAAISNGSAGGDVSSPEKRRADNAGVSQQSAGVDCSGFVSRCLKLPSVHDTAQLPAVCTELRSAQDLQPGDLLNIPRRHVILCAGWFDPQHTWIYYYETGGAPDYWKPGLKQAPLDALLALGYKPLRYKGMAYEPVPSGKQPRDVLTRAVKSKAAVVTNPTVGEP
jgi:cell wall-associated NlpC family hydrolase